MDERKGATGRDDGCDQVDATLIVTTVDYDQDGTLGLCVKHLLISLID